MHWHNVIETIWAFVHCFFRARFVVLRLDRGNAIAPQTLVTATVCSSRTSKQLYRGRFWRLEWLIWWFWPVFSRATTKKGQLFGFAPPQYFPLKPPMATLCIILCRRQQRRGKETSENVLVPMWNTVFDTANIDRGPSLQSMSGQGEIMLIRDNVAYAWTTGRGTYSQWRFDRQLR